MCCQMTGRAFDATRTDHRYKLLLACMHAARGSPTGGQWVIPRAVPLPAARPMTTRLHQRPQYVVVTPKSCSTPSARAS
jgi:hypothetical protein